MYHPDWVLAAASQSKQNVKIVYLKFFCDGQGAVGQASLYVDRSCCGASAL